MKKIIFITVILFRFILHFRFITYTYVKMLFLVNELFCYHNLSASEQILLGFLDGLKSYSDDFKWFKLDLN